MRCVVMCMLECLYRFPFLFIGSFLNPRVYNCSFLPCRPHPSPENPICPWSNALHHPHTSRQVFSPPRTRMRRPPQPQLQQASTCSLARLTSPAPFCRQIAIYDRRAQFGGRCGVYICGAAAQHGAAGGAGCAASTRGRPAAAECGAWGTSPARWRRTRWGASPRGGESGCEPGDDEAGAGASVRSPLEGTQNDVWRYRTSSSRLHFW
ncbi:hypothetical protein EDB83DRAFT_403654 [Lactarius deliciosus]|nr:hypothetical protein EDB83DRAFT_403654 [Lactarius deliciosus]